MFLSKALNLIMIVTILLPSPSFASEQNDFGDLFSGNSQGALMKYIYLVPSNILHVEENKDYYLFDEEVDIIKNNFTRFANIVNNHANIIEIGPGANQAVQSKTLPFLEALINPLSYTAIDIEPDYAFSSSKIIKDYFPNLAVSGISTDITEERGVIFTSILRSLNRKTILSFGSLFGNLSEASRESFLKYVTNLMNPGDLFMLTVDTNKDFQSIYKAYNNVNNDYALLNIMRYFKSKFKVDSFDPEAFKIERKWEIDHENSIGYLKAYAVPLREQAFSWNNKLYEIKEGNEYYLTFSAKFSKEYIEKICGKHGLMIKEILTNDYKRLNYFIFIKQ